ncbi:MAG: hypothetical protein A4E63_01920 [Syntrophorhabdus sp. PtaU1.Bin050]|nr:MAG: hypothetical protein A4E63_01920 [Syntrophorhabdus sp. PtaU1.Bin050]
MPVDVFHDHNGVINEDTDRENEGKKSHPVQSVAVEVCHKNSKGKGNRYRNGYNDRLPPAQCKGYENGYRKCGDEHMFQKFVGFFFSCFPVVPCSRDFYAGGDKMPL